MVCNLTRTYTSTFMACLCNQMVWTQADRGLAPVKHTVAAATTDAIRRMLEMYAQTARIWLGSNLANVDDDGYSNTAPYITRTLAFLGVLPPYLCSLKSPSPIASRAGDLVGRQNPKPQVNWTVRYRVFCVDIIPQPTCRHLFRIPFLPTTAR
jgi:hypothetical protein